MLTNDFIMTIATTVQVDWWWTDAADLLGQEYYSGTADLNIKITSLTWPGCKHIWKFYPFTHTYKGCWQIDQEIYKDYFIRKVGHNWFIITKRVFYAHIFDNDTFVKLKIIKF